MLLNAAISAQQSSHAQLQIQIDELQAKQREIQAYMQQLGSVESSMESAAQMLQQAIAEIRQVCPDELGNYQTLITGMFGDVPVAQLQPSDEPTPTVDEVIVTPPPSVEDEATVVDVVAVVEPETDSEPTPETTTPAIETEVETPVILPDSNGNGKVKDASTTPFDLPSVSRVKTMKRSDVQYWLAHFDLDSTGKVDELRNRLTAHLLSTRELSKN